jgi:voltage-gated sodium channel
LAPFYFISFILIGTMVILNLFIGVIMNGMEEAQEEAEQQREKERVLRGDQRDTEQALRDDLVALEKQVVELQTAIRGVAMRAHARREMEISRVSS